jgi:hypothetical protein
MLAMQCRTAIYTRSPGTFGEQDLRQKVEARGDVVAGIFVDQDVPGRRGRSSGWTALVAALDGVD